MLSLLAVALLTAVPASSTPSLLAPEAASSSRHLSARLLVAQAPPEAAPEAAPPSTLPGVEALDARILELTTQVGLLQSEIRSIDVNFPTGAVVMAYFGYSVSPLLLVGIPLIILGVNEDDAQDRNTLVNWGTGLSIAGAAGVGLLIASLVIGSNQSSDNRVRREELIRERIRMEDELRDLKARRAARADLQARRWQPRPTLPVVALRF